ncbi:hypothetical protein DY000_02016934 [Brassica cretica]|uniref:C-JID domain-containing protein n=1 Tax=Brassica cretica TaxID=69181 RepID=A0ABQ7D0C9_BRACR|nr:hypothetical protein DY000_02016934 [Brassica cretica]
MGCLEILLMDGTSIKQTPETIFLSNLKVFSFCGSSIEDSTELALLPFSGNSYLSDLYLTNYNIYKLPDNFSSLHSLRSLCLSRNNIKTLPESIEKLHCLLFLDLKNCRRLNSLPGLVLDPLVAVCFPGSDIPSWFYHQSMGYSIKIELLPHWCNNKFIGASLGVVVTCKDHEGHPHGPVLM